MAKDIEDIIAIAHYDDLQLFEDIVRTRARHRNRFRFFGLNLRQYVSVSVSV